MDLAELVVGGREPPFGGVLHAEGGDVEMEVGGSGGIGVVIEGDVHWPKFLLLSAGKLEKERDEDRQDKLRHLTILVLSKRSSQNT